MIDRYMDFCQSFHNVRRCEGHRLKETGLLDTTDQTGVSSISQNLFLWYSGLIRDPILQDNAPYPISGKNSGK